MRRLALRREALTELADEELRAAVGAYTGQALTCPFPTCGFQVSNVFETCDTCITGFQGSVCECTQGCG